MPVRGARSGPVQCRDLSLGLAREGASNAHSSYWLVLKARFTYSTSRDLSSGFVTRTSALFRSVRTTERLCSM